MTTSRSGSSANSELAVAETSRRPPRPWTVFGSAAFRKLWGALTLSLVGDLFSYVAMAWLVLQLTGSSFALGTVLLVQAVPRGLLMLVGGALVDRLSARFAMLASMGLRVLLVGSLAGLVLAGQVQLWEVYVASAVFGIVDAFFMPAQRTILPRIVADNQLEPGNAAVNVTNQVSVILNAKKREVPSPCLVRVARTVRSRGPRHASLGVIQYKVAVPLHRGVTSVSRLR